LPRYSLSIFAIFLSFSLAFNSALAKEVDVNDAPTSTVDGEGKAIPAAIPAIIAGLRVAYLTWQRSRAAIQVARLRETCTKAYQAYKKLTFTACKDRCGGQFDREKRDRCYEILIPEINITLDVITAELDARIAVLEWCAKTGIGVKEDGTPMVDDEGHREEIEVKRNAHKNCKAIASRRGHERGNRKGLDEPRPTGTGR
jgi:hypothetical protein